MNTKVQFLNKIIKYVVQIIFAVVISLSVGMLNSGQTLKTAAKGLASTVSEVDKFSGKIITTIPFIDTVDTSDATTNTNGIADPTPIILGDCDSNEGLASVWYNYKPASNTGLFIDTIGSSYDTVLAVWTGSEGNLTLVACNDDISLNELQSKVAFLAQANTTYFIEVIEFAQPAPMIQATRTLHLNVDNSGVVFDDVPAEHWAFSYVQDIFFAGITGGCSVSPPLYCPAKTVTRAQMAVFLLKAEHGSGYTPPAATGVFNDVPTSHWAADWIEQLAAEGITGGCGGGNYCPANPVTRAQMAVLLLRGEHGSGYTPPAATGVFNDVPTSHWAADWIEQLATESITGGCGGGNYCPANPVTRAQMAVFLQKTFGLSLP